MCMGRTFIVVHVLTFRCWWQYEPGIREMWMPVLHRSVLYTHSPCVCATVGEWNRIQNKKNEMNTGENTHTHSSCQKYDRATQHEKWEVRIVNRFHYKTSCVYGYANKQNGLLNCKSLLHCNHLHLYLDVRVHFRFDSLCVLRLCWRPSPILFISLLLRCHFTAIIVLFFWCPSLTIFSPLCSALDFIAVFIQHFHLSDASTKQRSRAHAHIPQLYNQSWNIISSVTMFYD